MLNARNLAAALSSIGADVESALLELVADSPTLDTLVRRELFRDCSLPKLHYINGHRSTGFYYTDTNCSRPICAMHAVDQLTRFFDDADIVGYLKTSFQELIPNVQEICV